MNPDRKSEAPEQLDDAALDPVQGGGLLDAEPGGFGYVGETEKNVWKAPAGLKSVRKPTSSGD